MAQAKIGLIIGSQRTPRAGRQISEFVHDAIKESSPEADISLVDLAEWKLPLYDEPEIPSRITSPEGYSHEHTLKWSREIASYDAFIFVTPQYNWGYPAGLKNAIDYLFNEWLGKPAMIVSYGGRGGGKAAAQLLEVLHGLHMKPVEETVGLAFPSKEELVRAAHGEDLGLCGDGSFWRGERKVIQDAFAKLEVLLQGDAA